MLTDQEPEPLPPPSGPRCQKCGTLYEDAESQTQGGVAYRCPNCGDYYDVGVPV